MAATFASPAYAAPALSGPRSGRRPAVRRAGAPSLRMTRRGRLVVLALALIVVLVPGAWRAMATAQVDGPTTIAVTVQPGDTLWGIAAEIDPGADPRALIAEIREVNSLTQSGLTPGQVLVVPAG